MATANAYPRIHAPAPRPWFVATCQGEYVESDRSLDRLLRVLREEIMDRGSAEDVVIHAGGRVVAVVRVR
ncbi:MAG TPA: hypothetical protein VJ739_13495 [Gemmataceae bacterium]|nr:hypothetical protein [Gemmataceae bacterium]